VARLAGIPDHVVERAREVLGRLGRGAGDLEQGAKGVRETDAEYAPGPDREHPLLLGDARPSAREERETGEECAPRPEQEHPLLPGDDEATQMALRDVLELDIANLTPVQALVILNDLQQQLRGEEEL
jgi:DNA mismatch repair ATPase MutS